jgi:hypothetical protein
MSPLRLLLIVLTAAIVAALWAARGSGSPVEHLTILKWAIRGLVLILFVQKALTRRPAATDGSTPIKAPPARTRFEPFSIPWSWIMFAGLLAAVGWLLFGQLRVLFKI